MPTMRDASAGRPWRARLLLVASGLLMAGCGSVWFNPYVPRPDRDLTQEFAGVQDFAKLRQAIVRAGQAQKNALTYRDDLAVGRSVLNYGTFGAAAGGGIAALYQAPRDMVLGFGLGATGLYGAGSLFASTDRLGSYAAANDTFRCIVNQAIGPIATAQTLDALTHQAKAGASGTDQDSTNARNKKELDGLIATFTQNKWSPELVEPASQASRRYDAALDNIRTFKALDISFAKVVDKATDTTFKVLDTKVGAVQPSLETILKTAQGIGLGAVAYTTQVTPAKPQAGSEKAFAAVAGAPTTPTAAQIELLKSLTKDVGDAATAIDNDVKDGTNQIDQLASTCVLDIASPPPLTVSQTSVTIGKNQTVVLVTSGGKLPLLPPVWEGTQPPADQIDVVTNGGDVILAGKAGLAAGAEFTLLLRDSMAAPNQVTVKVKGPSS